MCFKKEAVDRTDTVKKKFRPTKTHAHAKTIEACKKSSSNRKKNRNKGNNKGEDDAKAKVLYGREPEPKPHTRKKGNSCDGKRKSKAATMFVVVCCCCNSSSSFAYNLWPQGQKEGDREGEKCSKSCLWSDGRLKLFRWKMKRQKHKANHNNSRSRRGPGTGT